MEKTLAALSIALLIGIIVYPVIASSDSPRMNDHMMHFHVLDNIAIDYIYPTFEDNTSSSVQDERLTSLYNKYDNDSRDLKDELLAKNEEIHSLMTLGQHPDIGELKSIRNEINDIWNKLTQMSIDLQFEEQKIDPDYNY